MVRQQTHTRKCSQLSPCPWMWASACPWQKQDSQGWTSRMKPRTEWGDLHPVSPPDEPALFSDRSSLAAKKSSALSQGQWSWLRLVLPQPSLVGSDKLQLWDTELRAATPSAVADMLQWGLATGCSNAQAWEDELFLPTLCETYCCFPSQRWYWIPRGIPVAAWSLSDLPSFVMLNFILYSEFESLGQTPPIILLPVKISFLNILVWKYPPHLAALKLTVYSIFAHEGVQMLRKDYVMPQQSKTIKAKQTASHLLIFCLVLQSLQCNSTRNLGKETNIMLLMLNTSSQSW